MKSKFNYYKKLSFILVFVIFLQGCSVYKMTPVSLNQTSQVEAKVKIHTVDGRVLKFKNVSKSENIFYGTVYAENRTKDVLLFEKDLESIYEKR